MAYDNYHFINLKTFALHKLLTLMNHDKNHSKKIKQSIPY